MLTLLPSLLLLICVGCDPTESVSESSGKSLIRGKIAYRDVVNGKLIENNSDIKVTLKSRDKLNQFVIDELEEINGFEFEFGPLLDGHYQVDVEFIDTSTGVKYQKTEMYSVPSLPPINENIELQPDKLLLQVSLTYIDPLTNSVQIPDSPVDISIYHDHPSIEVAEELITRIDNNSYVIGPIEIRNYEVRSNWTSTLGVQFMDISSVNLGSNNDFNAELEWNSSTVSLVIVKDSLGNPINNTDVYLYNNYTFLQMYPGNAEASIRTAITNKDGQVFFSEL
ncbi:MAG: hypothetical protein MI974_01140, partial [Chitinophagales bacterium]|nr:hypothetical protein [Chitinophagales bacterium]